MGALPCGPSRGGGHGLLRRRASGGQRGPAVEQAGAVPAPAPPPLRLPPRRRGAVLPGGDQRPCRPPGLHRASSGGAVRRASGAGLPGEAGPPAGAALLHLAYCRRRDRPGGERPAAGQGPAGKGRPLGAPYLPQRRPRAVPGGPHGLRSRRGLAGLRSLRGVGRALRGVAAPEFWGVRGGAPPGRAGKDGEEKAGAVTLLPNKKPENLFCRGA